MMLSLISLQLGLRVRVTLLDRHWVKRGVQQVIVSADRQTDTETERTFIKPQTKFIIQSNNVAGCTEGIDAFPSSWPPCSVHK